MAVFVADNKIKLPKKFGRKVNNKAYRQFLEKLGKNNEIKFAVFTFPFSIKDPLSYLNQVNAEDKFSFYSEKPNNKKAIVGGGITAEITASGPNRFREIQQQIKQTDKQTLHFNATSNKQTEIRFLGGFSFFNEIETEDWYGFKSASFVLSKRTIIKNEVSTTLSIAIPLDSERSPERIHNQLLQELGLFEKKHIPNSTFNKCTPNSFSSNSPIAYSDWKSSIKNIKDDIGNNIFSKIVLARELNISFNINSTTTEILQKLRTQYPNCCTYLIQQGDSKAFIGSSPERLLSFNGNAYQTEALAGSMPRGSDKASDLSLENKLNGSFKNKEEHSLVVEHFKDVLTPVAQYLNISEHTFVKKLANVQHLYTPIHFKSNTPSLKILEQLHPTPALGGYPQKTAVNYLDKYGLINRGLFGAPLGWISSNKGEFSVAIRCGLVGKHKAKLYAGCGIVADSNPKSEWNETDLKFNPMLTALRNEQE